VKTSSEEDESEADDEFVDKIGSLQKLPTVVKMDMDNQSTMTYITESSRLTNGSPSTVLSSSCDTDALALRLNFLARQLEIERAQREKLNQ